MVDAEYVIHLSLSIGNDINWPFGTSILEPIFKVFKQKELLEDAIIIYRVQRAPERRIFYIDTGTMPPERAKRHIEAIKNDIHQRRIPNRTGNGGNILDAAYNPLCLATNTPIHLVDGRILSLAELIDEHDTGKENWVYSCDPTTGEIMTGPITWAGITRRDAEVVQLTFDNGKDLICTPDHKIPVLGKGDVPAHALHPTDDLIALNNGAGGKRHVATIEPYGRMDVGTLTIDRDEVYHPHHNFAIAADVFVKNSINDDYFLAMCLRLDTRIVLLDGRTLTLTEIIKEHEEGKQNWVYSLNVQTHEFEPGRIAWAGVTRRDAALVRVTLDNGEYIDATPDHRFILRDGSEVQAADLKSDDTLMPLPIVPFYAAHAFYVQHDRTLPVLIEHTVASVEILTHRSDTGDVTVESPSGSHLFALAAGIYVHNSSDGRGSKVETLPGGECFALDTKFPLLDGRTLSLTDIISEFEDGKQLWAYSCNPETGQVVPGIINWAGVTRKDAKVGRITFDNGKSVTVTPDHKFPVQGRGKIEARDLRIGDSMFPHMTRKEPIRKDKNEYTQVFDNESKKWVFVHRMVAEYFHSHPLVVQETVFDEKFKDDNKNIVHHKDFNRFNNDPENLTWVNWADHYKYHSKCKDALKRHYEMMSDEEYDAWCAKMRQVNIDAFARKTNSEKAEFIAQSIENLKNGKATERQVWLLQNNPTWREQVLLDMGAGIAAAFTPERRSASRERLRTIREGMMDQLMADQTLVLDEEVFDAVTDLVGPDTSTMRSLVQKVNASPVLERIRAKNANTKARNVQIERFKIASRHIIKILGDRGLKWKSWRDQLLGERKMRASKKFKTTIDMMRSVVGHFHAGVQTMDSMIECLNADTNFIGEVQKENVAVHHLARNDRVGREHLMTILQDHGYESWKQFKANDAAFNHQVVSIEWLDETMDTGTLTIDGAEIYHGYHTVALDCCIYAMNSVGEIQDLMYFTRKIARGMRVPTSYINLGDGDEGQSVTFNDGKLGAAMIQEYRFTKYCMRWQALLGPIFDKEYKRFLIKNGIEMDWGLFELQFRPPQSFTKYRQIELDAQSVQVYQGVAENKRLSERFKLKRFLGLSEDEMIENEKLWSEENAEKLKRKTGGSPADQPVDGLSAVGVRPMGDEMPPDMPPEEGGEEMPPGPEGAAPGGGGGMPGAAPANAAPMGAGAPGGM